MQALFGEYIHMCFNKGAFQRRIGFDALVVCGWQLIVGRSGVLSLVFVQLVVWILKLVSKSW